jgi:hypothetical protein
MKVPTRKFALCIDNSGYQASLIPGKVYRLVADTSAAREGMIRVIDESGEDYLFQKSHFVGVDFPASVQRKLLAIEALGTPAR